MYYKLIVSRQIGEKINCYGSLESVQLKGKAIERSELSQLNFYESAEQLDSVEVLLKDLADNYVPDIVFLDYSSGFLANKKFVSILEDFNIGKTIVPLETQSDLLSGYMLVLLEEVDMVDLEKSNLELKNERVVSSGLSFYAPGKDELILNEVADLDFAKARGIPLNVCSEKFLAELKKEGVTGFDYEKI